MTDAGVVRRYPEEDPRCSEDDTIRAWVTYDNGRTLYIDFTISPQGYSGYFIDLFGDPWPHPFDAGRNEDGSLSCQFIGM